jgi:hypothetical protein
VDLKILSVATNRKSIQPPSENNKSSPIHGTHYETYVFHIFGKLFECQSLDGFETFSELSRNIFALFNLCELLEQQIKYYLLNTFASFTL